jgi:uncharacterized protein
MSCHPQLLRENICRREWVQACEANKMFKAILLVFVLFLVYWVFWGSKSKRAPGEVGPASDNERMVVCAYCQLRVPESEAVADAGKFFCCDEHRRLDAL